MLRHLAALMLLTLPTLAGADSLRVYNWNDYIDEQVLADFTKATGIEVDYRTYATAEELDTLLRSGERIDVAVPQHDSLPSLIQEQRLQPLDIRKLSNYNQLDKQLLGKLAAFDPQNRYAAPYQWGVVGLAVNMPKVEAALGRTPENSWGLLFDPANSQRLASCGISILDAPDELLTILLNYQGESLVHSSPSRIRRTRNILSALRPNLRYISNDRYIEPLQKGELCLSMAWVGDALGAIQAGQPINFLIPEEGTALFIDSLAIPTSAQQVDQAHRFIDYLLQAKVAARNTQATLYPNGNAQAYEHLDPALRDLPGLYPDRATKRRLSALPALPEKLSEARDQTWNAFKQDL